MAETITTSARREDLAAVVRRLPGILSGRLQDVRGIGAGFRARITFVLFALIQDRFEKLGQGGSDENGESWPALSQSYLAYGRPVKGQNKWVTRGGRRVRVPQGGGLAGGSGDDGLLSKAQDASWWRHYSRNVGWLVTRHSPGEAKGIAAALAWKAVKAEGGRTKWADPGFGGRQVGDYQILRNTGTLAVSLSAGDLSEGTGPAATYAPPAEQTVEAKPGTLIVGTRAAFAAAHHHGKGKLPARRLWPATIPSSWWRQILDQSLAGLAQIGTLFKSGAIR